MSINNSVVKLISFNIDFDWFNPYKVLNDTTSTGSGFFISDKYILTCAHVIDGSTQILFTTPITGKKKYKAVVIGICYDKDIALLKSIDYKSEYINKLGNSDLIKEEDEVKAIGYPLSQDNPKSTKGIISGRQGTYLQTDAPINPGNSGGALLNKNNEVIGINSAKISSNVAENIGFSIPINDYKIIQKDLLDKNNLIIKKPSFVSDFNNSTKELINFYNLDDNVEGYLIKKIYKTSPFKKTNLKKGDLLCYFDNFKIDNFGECKTNYSNYKIHINDLLDRYPIGSSVEIKYLPLSIKDNKNIELKTENIIFKNQDYYKLKMFYPPFENIDYEILGGFIFMNLTINHIIKLDESDVYIKNLLNLKQYIKKRKRFKNRVFIANILGGSLINTNNILKNGDVIKRVNNIKIRTLDDLRKAIHKPVIKNNVFYITIKTKNSNFFVMNLQKIYEKEKILSIKYKYNLSKIYSQLFNIYSQSKNNIIKKYKFI